MRRNGVRAVVLDFDGVVLETDFPWLRAWEKVFTEHGQTFDSADWSKFVGADESLDPCDLLIAKGVHLSEEERRKVTGQAVDAAIDVISRARPRRGILRLLQRARTAGVPVAIATNGSRRWIEQWLPRDVSPLVSTVVTKDDVQRPKPAPDLFVTALTRLGLDPAEDARYCVGVEDSTIGATAVIDAGLHCLYVPTRLTRDVRMEGAKRVRDLQCLTIESLDRMVGAPDPHLSL